MEAINAPLIHMYLQCQNIILTFYQLCWSNIHGDNLCTIHPKHHSSPFSLFDLILYIPSTIFQLNRDRSSWVEPVLSKDKCVLLKDHKAVTPVRLEPTALGLESSILPLSHCAPYSSPLKYFIIPKHYIEAWKQSKHYSLPCKYFRIPKHYIEAWNKSKHLTHPHWNTL